MTLDADVLIAGGGLVGGGLACALAALPLRVIQVEAQPARAGGEARWDERSFALARRTVQSLRSLGVWSACAGEAQAIAHVHVSSRGDFGAVRVHARDYGIDTLGHTVPARVLAQALAARVSAIGNLERFVPARLTALRVEADHAVATLMHDGGRSRDLRVRLVVGADGTESFVRMAAGVGARRHDYAQTAIVTAITATQGEPGWAYERLTDTGPFALLPLGGERYGLVWTTTSDEAVTLLALDDDAFLAAAQARFGSRLGRWRRVGARQPWPLASTTAEAVTAARVVLVGNAAQTIHPVGAQGFNLGLRDAMALAAQIGASSARGEDIGGAAMLRRTRWGVLPIGRTRYVYRMT